MRAFLTIGFVVWVIQITNGQSSIDSITTLPVASVTARQVDYGASFNQDLQLLPKQVLSTFEGETFAPALNRVPGVRFEQRAPGSYRISIRSTSRRSPFGVRGTQVYWNGIPLTEPGGDTPLNFLDPTNVDELVVHKGSFNVAIGNPLGGGIFLSTQAENSEVGLLGGSFGMAAANVQLAKTDSNTAKLDVRLSHRQSDGFREHSAFRRSTAQASILSAPSVEGPNGWKIETRIDMLATRLDYELPGALNPAQFEADPRQARPGSAQTNASIDYENVLVGTGIQAKKSGIQLNGTTYISGFRFDNPFNVNHKRETNMGFGARGNLSFAVDAEKLRVQLGGESQFQFRDARQYDPGDGNPGDLQFSDDIYTRRLLGYGLLDGYLGQRSWLWKMGLSLQDLSYIVDRTFERDGIAGQSVSEFTPVLAPSASISYLDSKDFSVTLAYARGYSTPSLREFRTNEGGINTRLKPEVGNSLELSFQWQADANVRFRGNGYFTQLTQTITSFQDTSGIVLFRNAGSTLQPGVELAAEWMLVGSGTEGILSELTASLAYSYTRYRYVDYEVDGVSFAERPLPGQPDHTLDFLLTGRLGRDLRVDLNVRSESENPLDDAGIEVANSFVLTRIGFDYALLEESASSRRILSIYGYVDNVFDIRYSLGNDINPAFGNRYYQSAPGRNFALGLRLR